jgi:hypothetical protein
LFGAASREAPVRAEPHQQVANVTGAWTEAPLQSDDVPDSRSLGASQQILGILLIGGQRPLAVYVFTRRDGVANESGMPITAPIPDSHDSGPDLSLVVRAHEDFSDQYLNLSEYFRQNLTESSDSGQ